MTPSKAEQIIKGAVTSLISWHDTGWEFDGIYGTELRHRKSDFAQTILGQAEVAIDEIPRPETPEDKEFCTEIVNIITCEARLLCMTILAQYQLCIECFEPINSNDGSVMCEGCLKNSGPVYDSYSDDQSYYEDWLEQSRKNLHNLKIRNLPKFEL